MDPGLYLPHHDGPPGWPWSVIDLFGGTDSLVILGEHHIVPALVCDLLRAETWDFSCDCTVGPSVSASVSGMVAGTLSVDVDSTVTVYNSPGWATQREVIERRDHGDDEWTDGLLVAVRVTRNFSDSGVDYELWTGADLFLPLWGWDDTDPAWFMQTRPILAPLNTGVFEEGYGVLVQISGGDRSAVSSTQSLDLMGETIGTPTSGWEVALDVASWFA